MLKVASLGGVGSFCLVVVLGVVVFPLKLTDTETEPRFRKGNWEQVENVYSVKMVPRCFQYSPILVASGGYIEVSAEQVRG